MLGGRREGGGEGACGGRGRGDGGGCPRGRRGSAKEEEGGEGKARRRSRRRRRRSDAARNALDAARQSFGPHPDILTYQGYTWRKLGALDRAETYYKQALAIAPNHRGATEYYGELKVERGDLAGARALLARLDHICAFDCAEAEELRRWIDLGHAPQG